jgi:hypothetical protein
MNRSNCKPLSSTTWQLAHTLPAQWPRPCPFIKTSPLWIFFYETGLSRRYPATYGLLFLSAFGVSEWQLSSNILRKG